MASYTTNLNLKKPAGSENVAIGDINNNMDIIDQAFGSKFTRHVDSIGDNNLGINVSHTYNGSVHQILISGTLTQALNASTKYELAPSTGLTNFVSYVPAFNFDTGRWGYFYISDGKLCVQFKEAWTSGISIRYLLTWV